MDRSSMIAGVDIRLSQQTLTPCSTRMPAHSACSFNPLQKPGCSTRMPARRALCVCPVTPYPHTLQALLIAYLTAVHLAGRLTGHLLLLRTAVDTRSVLARQLQAFDFGGPGGDHREALHVGALVTQGDPVSHTGLVPMGVPRVADPVPRRLGTYGRHISHASLPPEGR